DGAYTAVDVPVGTVNLYVNATGYAPQSIQATVQNGLTTAVNVSLVPTGSAPTATPTPTAAPTATPTAPPSGNSQQVTVALTWGASPADLDIHMSGPASGGSRFHLYWNNRDAAPYAAISGDDDNGGGPETITIKKNPATGAWVPGEYRIWAHNYSG